MAGLLASAQCWSWSVDDNMVQNFFSQSLKRQLGPRSSSVSRRPLDFNIGNDVISTSKSTDRGRPSIKLPGGLPNGFRTEALPGSLTTARRGYERRNRTISLTLSSTTVKSGLGSGWQSTTISSRTIPDGSTYRRSASRSSGNGGNALPNGNVSRTMALKANIFANTLEKGNDRQDQGNTSLVRPGYGLMSRLGMFGQISEINDHLFLSGVQPLRPDHLRQKKITSVINATVDEPSMYLSGIDCLKIRVEDSPFAHLDAYFDVVADRIKSKKDVGGKVLVHCVAGISRSASLVMVYLMKHQGMSLRDAYWRVKSIRPIIRPNIGFWRQMIKYEMRLFGKNTVKLVPSKWESNVPDVYTDELKACEPTPRQNSEDQQSNGSSGTDRRALSASTLRPSQRIVPITRGISAVRPTGRTRQKFNAAGLRPFLSEF